MAWHARENGALLGRLFFCPFDRCERTSVLRDALIALLPKPTPAKLTDAERRAIYDYTGSSYRMWNSSLRGGGPPAQMLAFDSAIAKHEVGADLVVYRGLGSGHPIHKLASSNSRSGSVSRSPTPGS